MILRELEPLAKRSNSWRDEAHIRSSYQRTEGLDWFGRDGQKWSVGTYVGIGTTNNYLKVSDMYCSYSVDQMRATKIDADKNI